MSIPPTVYIALGVITAALFTGFFSIMNMVSAKENKVSEFRLAWIDGMRNEIAEYTAAAQEISKAQKPEKFKGQKFHTDAEKHELEIEFFKETRDVYAKAVENLTKIQLRLNPEHIKQNPDGPESKLMEAVLKARKLKSLEFKEVILCCEEIRAAASPILKTTWDSVKRGEPGYQRIRKSAILTVAVGFYSIIGFAMYIGVNTYKIQQDKIEAQLSAPKTYTAPTFPEQNADDRIKNKNP